MQVKIFTLPIVGAERINDEMNTFLRSRKILNVEKQFVTVANTCYWSFCVTYLEEVNSTFDKDRPKVDYRQVLDAETFKRFSKLREIRKRIATDDAVPAYAIFTDEELSQVAKIEVLTLASLKTIKGIGEKKVEKYGQFFVEPKDASDEKD